jgi:hypothetical protein
MFCKQDFKGVYDCAVCFYSHYYTYLGVWVFCVPLFYRTTLKSSKDLEWLINAYNRGKVLAVLN